MRFVLFFLLALLPASVANSATDPCKGLYAPALIVSAHEVWQSRDERLRKIVRSITNRVGIENPLVCETATAHDSAITFWLGEEGNKRYVFLFNQAMVAVLSDDALASVAAHEAAHVIRRSRIVCTNLCPRMIAEEIATDLLAARWVGRANMIKGLEELKAYMEAKYSRRSLRNLYRQLEPRFQALKFGKE